MTAEVSRLDDDEPVRMTVNERTVRASLVAVIVSSATYVTLVARRLFSQPVAEISWVAPMLRPHVLDRQPGLPVRCRRRGGGGRHEDPAVLPSLEGAYQIARIFGLPLEAVFQYEAPHD